MLRRLLLALLAGALVAACSSDQDTDTARTEQPAATHNEADMAFARGMIPHHQQAIEMAKLVDDRTERPELRTLADSIIKTQGEELSLMERWLRAWNADPAGGMNHGPTGDGGGMAGMMTKAQMDELMRLEDTKFDLAFVEMMSEHHQGAITMAETELRDGVNADAKKLASQVITDQRKEIETMTSWSQAWSAGS